jgi:hypothetical protein
MKKPANQLLLAAISVFAGGILTPFAAVAADLRGTMACTASERWTYAPEIDADSRIRFETLVLPQVSPMRNYGDGLALARSGTTARARLFGEYWRARALFTGKLETDALEGFAAVAGSLPSGDTVGIQVAAIECMNRIHDRDPALALPADLRARLGTIYSLTSTPASRQPLYEMTVNLLDAQLSDGNSASKSDAFQMMALLKGSGPYESFAQGLWSASQAEHKEVIASLEKLFGKPQSELSLPASLKKHLVHAHLLLARAYYSTQQFEKAAAQYQLVERSSNETPEMLNELAWSYLMAQRYADAVGTATNLQVGRLRHTFAPEAPIVTAMSSNELSQFPDALRSVGVFKHEYATSYQWVYEWNKDRKPLYNLAIRYLQKQDTSNVPDRIAGEWIRSNYFISHQQEIHRLFAEKQVSERFARSAADVQSQVIGQIKDTASDLNAGVREEKDGALQIVSTDAIPKSHAPDYEKLKASVADYNRMHEGAAAFEASQASRDSRADAARSRLVAEINADLARRTEKMRKVLEEVAENSKLIEVEIYNGASHDMIWRNAHPDFASVEKKVKVAYTKPIGHTLNWGTIDPAKSDKVEVWEDELGAFKANLHDNCSSKERYLALKGSGV